MTSVCSPSQVESDYYHLGGCPSRGGHPLLSGGVTVDLSTAEFVLKYGLGGIALWQVYRLRREIRDGFAEVADGLKDHEHRITRLEGGERPSPLDVAGFRP